MAKILLNVEVNKADLKQVEEQLSKALNASSSTGGKSGGGTKSATVNVDNLRKSYANLLNQIKTLEKQYPQGMFENIKTQVKAQNEAVKNLCKDYRLYGKLTEEQQDLAKRLGDRYKRLSADTAQLRAESVKLQKENKLAIPNVDNLRKKYANLLNTIQGTEKYYRKGTFSSLTKEIRKNLTSLQQLDPTTADYAVKVNELDKQLNKLSAQFSETKVSSQNMHGSFLEIVKGFAKFQLSAMVVMKPLQMIRNAWADLNETLVKTEDAVVALRRVAGDSANANELYDLAQRYGQTFENVSEIATNFARAGYEWNETIKATEAALLALNTAELEATEASDGMIAILQQFGYEANQLESIIDKLNITADNAAVSTDALLKALARTGSSAKNARLSLEETVSVITALSEATGRSGENLGTAINSLIQFSTKSSALDTFAKLGGNVEKTVELYRQGGATVLDIWRELSKVISNSQTAESILGENFTTEEFEALNEELKDALGESFAQTTEIYDTASTFRKNYFIALLQNLDQVQESLDTMNNSQGYSQRENQQYLDTYTAKVNSLQAKWQDMLNSEQGFLDFKKRLVDWGDGLLDILASLGGIETILESIILGIAPYTTVKFFTTIITSIQTIFAQIRLGAVSVQTAAGWIGVALSALSVIGGILEGNKEKQRSIAENAEREAQARRSSAALSINTSEIDFSSIYESIDRIKELRDSEYLTAEATNELLSIQSNLVKNNEELAGSIDLVNGSLDDQVEKLKEVADAKIKNWIAVNKASINESKGILSETGYFASESSSNKKIAEIAKKAGLHNIKYDWDWEDYERFGEDLPLIGGVVGDVIDFFDPEGAGRGIDLLTVRGTREESLNDLNSLYEYIENNYTGTDKDALLGDISRLIGSINTEDYKNAKETYDYYKKAQKYLSGEISYQEFVTGVAPSGGGSTGTTNLSDVVNKLEAIRENTEKTKELEEKALALQEARNQRTVRVFNAETGQWEMQANEKDIAEAEDAALDSIVDYLKTGEAQSKLNEGAFTLPKWLLDKISKPTSDDQFNAFMSLMGIMSGAVNKTPMSTGAVYNNSSNNTTNNNQSYSLNGIPIPANEADKYFTPEALALLNQMGD